MVREVAAAVVPVTLKQARTAVDGMVNGTKKVSEFARKVYACTMLVPKGKVTTYKALATAVGCGSPRAVGQALRHNPFAPTVPCHRVVATSRGLGGFFGHTSGAQMDSKVALLQSEGVRFNSDKVDATCVLSRL